VAETGIKTTTYPWIC